MINLRPLKVCPDERIMRRSTKLSFFWHALPGREGPASGLPNCLRSGSFALREASLALHSDVFFISRGFWAGRKSAIFGVWAAPGGRETFPKGGGLRPPTFWRVYRLPEPPRPPKSMIPGQENGEISLSIAKGPGPHRDHWKPDCIRCLAPTGSPVPDQIPSESRVATSNTV